MTEQVLTSDADEVNDCPCGGRILFFYARNEVAHTEPECEAFTSMCAELEHERPPEVVEVVG